MKGRAWMLTVWAVRCRRRRDTIFVRPPYSKAGRASPDFWFSRAGPMTTDRLAGSYAKKMNFFSSPVWLLGGWPGFETAFRLRILDRAPRRTKAPNRESTFLSARLVAATTRAESKNNPFILSMRYPIIDLHEM
jgi:hypothetical protein